VNRELVNEVAQQVMRMLRQGTPAATGVIAAAGADTHNPPQTEKPAKVFLTADALQQRIAAGGSGSVELAHNEYLTPNAIDLADRKRLVIRRAVAMLPKAPQPGAGSGAMAAVCAAMQKPPMAELPAAPTSLAIGLVTDKADDRITAMLAGLAREGLALADCNQSKCWMANLCGLCQTVTGGSLAGGVAILPYAADAMVLANKVRGIRAVQGTSAASVSAAMRHFAANVLVLEHAVSSFHQLRQMIGLFARSREAVPAASSLIAMLDDLENNSSR
jgi:ribose 5-phosphate isomerase RpiB